MSTGTTDIGAIRPITNETTIERRSFNGYSEMRMRGLCLQGRHRQRVTKDGKAFCCDACANGHPDKAGCDHAGCECHG